MNVTRAWVWIVGQSSQYKEMQLEDIKTLCKEKDLRIAKNGVIFDVDEYTFSSESEPIRQYCFTIGHYERPPHIDLVPNGTKVVDGRYVLPKV